MGRMGLGVGRGQWCTWARQFQVTCANKWPQAGRHLRLLKPWRKLGWVRREVTPLQEQDRCRKATDIFFHVNYTGAQPVESHWKFYLLSGKQDDLSCILWGSPWQQQDSWQTGEAKYEVKAGEEWHRLRWVPWGQRTRTGRPRCPCGVTMGVGCEGGDISAWLS